MDGFGERYFAHLEPNEPHDRLHARAARARLQAGDLHQQRARVGAAVARDAAGGRDLRRRRGLRLRRHPQARAAHLRAHARGARGRRRRRAAHRRHRGQLHGRARAGHPGGLVSEHRAGDRRHRGGAGGDGAGGAGAVAWAGRRAGRCPLCCARAWSPRCCSAPPQRGTPDAPGAREASAAGPTIPPTRPIAGDPKVTVVGAPAGRWVRRSPRDSWASRSSSRACAPTPAQTPRTSTRCSSSSSATSRPGQAPVLRIGGNSTDVSYVAGPGRQAAALPGLSS